MTDYIHDEWCASREGPEAPGPCNCYVAVIRRRESRIEELERAALAVRFYYGEDSNEPLRMLDAALAAHRPDVLSGEEET